jgi:hypothetical protein
VSFSGMPPWRHDDTRPPTAARLRRSLTQLALAALVVGLAALAVGWLFARGDASGAARLLLADDVEVEESQEAGPGPDPTRPTSGPQRGAPTCGVLASAPPPADQVASLAAGVVILHHRDGAGDATMTVLRDLVDEHERVLVVPAPGLDVEVVATAWRHRYEQPSLSERDLERFVVGWMGAGPRPRDCP